jgi:sterol desaturase/sphingolipid hydroxylase (fatty acid hydroxylase superfamily)
LTKNFDGFLQLFLSTEHFVSNLLPAGMGPILCGSDPVTMWVWYTIVISVTLNSHSGYHLPFMPSPEAHDFHHLRFNQVKQDLLISFFSVLIK